MEASRSPYHRHNEIFKVPADEQMLKEQNIRSWPTWGHGVDKFPWTYDGDEESYILEGRVIVTPNGGSPVEIKAGEFVVFPNGMACTWDIKEPIKKHYKLY